MPSVVHDLLLEIVDTVSDGRDFHIEVPNVAIHFLHIFEGFTDTDANNTVTMSKQTMEFIASCYHRALTATASPAACALIAARVHGIPQTYLPIVDGPGGLELVSSRAFERRYQLRIKVPVGVTPLEKGRLAHGDPRGT